ncbi:hypothetical protein [Sphingopyxis sp. PET50]|uniref:hypothetical protein n=1 Tax=Sphingopyxis sp. PET50 TaxID=2976533 RepID=UPI0021AEA5AF|nr:hypothetical protein [Sphingopyxis sp. PET50]
MAGRLALGVAALGGLGAVARGEAPPAPREEVTIALRADSEQLIGRQSEQTSTIAGGGLESVRRSESAYMVSGHGPTELSETLRIATDADGAPIRWQWRRSANGRAA